MIPALSIRQPWAWLIVHDHKDIENRDWSTPFRGQLLVHAGLSMTRAYYDQMIEALGNASMLPAGGLHSYEDLPRGGLVGWWAGPASSTAWNTAPRSGNRRVASATCCVLRDSRPMPFVPWKGRLQFFNVPGHALEAHSHEAR